MATKVYCDADGMRDIHPATYRIRGRKKAGNTITDIAYVDSCADHIGDLVKYTLDGTGADPQFFDITVEPLTKGK